MGILSWIGDAVKSIKIAPNGILDRVSQLAGVISEVVPIVGPVVSHALPVLTSIFGSSERCAPSGGDAIFAEVSKLEKNQELILDMIKDVKHALEQNKGDILKAVQDASERDKLLKYYTNLAIAMSFFDEKQEILKTLTPESGEDRILSFVDLSGAPSSTHLRKNLDTLVEQRIALEEHFKTKLGEHSAPKDFAFTAELLDIYMLTVTWLLVYEKALLHLRSYLAKGYLMSNEIDKYVKCMSKWNEDFISTRYHIYAAIQFILGEKVGVTSTTNPNNKGLLLKLRDERISEKIVRVDDSNIVDNWPETAFGYAVQEQKLIMSRSQDGKDHCTIDFFKRDHWMHYQSLSFTYFDLSAQRIVEVVEKWQDSLVKWNSRIPLSPPISVGGENVRHINAIDVPPPNKGEKEKNNWKGYVEGTTVQYAISYVTSQGEGFTSQWTEPAVSLEDPAKLCVKLKVEPVMDSISDPLKQYKVLENKSGHSGKGFGTIRRVYVKYKVPGNSIGLSWVADMMPHETQLVDGGIRSHGKLNATSLATLPGEGELPSK